jgi:hypothetical protein
MGWWHGSCGTTPEFKPQHCQKKKNNNNLIYIYMNEYMNSMNTGSLKNFPSSLDEPSTCVVLPIFKINRKTSPHTWLRALELQGQKLPGPPRFCSSLLHRTPLRCTCTSCLQGHMGRKPTTAHKLGNATHLMWDWLSLESWWAQSQPPYASRYLD